METQTAPKVVGPTDGKAGTLAAIGVRFMIGGEDAGGRFSLVEHPMPPRALAAESEIVLCPLADDAAVTETLLGPVGALAGARLSRGEVNEDNISCRYHGVTLDGTGTIVRVPAMPGCALEGRKAVDSYAVIEANDGIFVYFPSA